MRKRKGNKGWGSFVQTLILITYALDGVKEDLSSGRSRPSDNGGGGGGRRSSRPSGKGGRSPEKFFSVLRALVLKTRGDPPLDSPLLSL